MYKERICEICGKTFKVERKPNGNYSTVTYCSDDCYREKLYRNNLTHCKFCGKEYSKYVKETGKRNKSEFCSKECQKNYYDQSRKKTICAFCGKEFLQPRDENGKIRNVKYCSDVCREQAEQQNIKKRVCLNCGKELPVVYTDSGHISNKKFCNDNCAHEYYDKTQLKEKTCLYCGKQFKPIRLENGKLSQSNYCSDDCWYKGTQNKFISACRLKYGVDYPVLRQEAQVAQGSIVSNINKKFYDLLKQNSIDCKFEKRFSDVSYDIEIENSNILIEINPTYTHTVIGNHFNNWQYNKKMESYHLDKTKTAEDKGYTCVHIWDWDDWNKIITILKPKVKLYARKLKLKETTKQEANVFINNYHLQGSCYGNSINLGLYLDDRLVQIMTFGKPRYNKNYEWELLRLCTHSDFMVVGGAERLFKYFITNYKPESVISYCDRSKFSGNVYRRLNFKSVKQTSPAKIWSKGKNYITDNLLRQRGFDQLFKTNYGKGTSNEELMLSSGWKPVYDCGQEVFIWKN